MLSQRSVCPAQRQPRGIQRPPDHALLCTLCHAALHRAWTHGFCPRAVSPVLGRVYARRRSDDLARGLRHSLESLPPVVRMPDVAALPIWAGIASPLRPRRGALRFQARTRFTAPRGWTPSAPSGGMDRCLLAAGGSRNPLPCFHPSAPATTVSGREISGRKKRRGFLSEPRPRKTSLGE